MTLLAVYFIIILDYRNDVRQRANSSSFFEFSRMGWKAAERTRHININNAFGPGTATKRTVQWWFKFCKRDESLEDAEHSGQLSVGDSNQLRVSLKLILLKLHEKLLKNSLLTILWLVDI